MNATKVNAFVAALRVPEGAAALGRFLNAARRALTNPNDASLARTLGVPPATLASWRRRGQLSEAAIAWFDTAFCAKVILYNPELPGVGQTAREAVIRLILETEGDPLGNGVGGAARALGGLLALAQFLIDSAEERPTAAAVASLLTGALVHMSIDHGAVIERYEP